MIVASLGIFIGATFSSGMMEIARKGIFNPEYFYFSEIMIIFLAVMVTDIFLLDLFNTFGLPTSTTVSIVFELLGAAAAVSFYKVFHSGGGIQDVGNYLNGSSALMIIAGIFLSIGIAFIIGAIVQFISRLLFTFHYEKKLTIVGGIWSGLALSGLTYFLLFKGIKGASFVSDEFILWVKENTLMLVIGAAILWTIIMQLLVSMYKINILKFVVLFGTFSLAMAFAGNDLVNFIGVPIAGLESYQLWSQSDIPASQYTMEVLREPVRTDSLLLVIGGGVMIVTLWFSKKARSVTETEVNLGRDGSQYERFTPNTLSRSIVRGSISGMNAIIKFLPNSWKEKMEKNYRVKRKSHSWNEPAFDLVRASVNLTMAGILISFATSLRLPLSTTYVSFMVAMGTSLADRAWGRNSAVYRISGVLSVIGGWFMTAIIAFLVSGTFAFLMVTFSIKLIYIILPVIGGIIFYTFHLHKQNLERKEERERIVELSETNVQDQLSQSIRNTLSLMGQLSKQAIQGVINEDLELLKLTVKSYKKTNQKLDDWNGQLYQAIKSNGLLKNGILKDHIRCYDLQQDMMQSLSWVVKNCSKHVKNSHEPPSGLITRRLNRVLDRFMDYHSFILKQTEGNIDLASIKVHRKELQSFLNEILESHIETVQKGEVDDIIGKMVIGLILELKDMIAISERLIKISLHNSKA
jgi:phosphate/sulfate permease